MLDKKTISVVVTNAEPAEVERIGKLLAESAFGDEYVPVVTSSKMEFPSVEVMVQSLEGVLNRLKTALPDKGTVPENPLFPPRGVDE